VAGFITVEKRADKTVQRPKDQDGEPRKNRDREKGSVRHRQILPSFWEREDGLRGTRRYEKSKSEKAKGVSKGGGVRKEGRARGFNPSIGARLSGLGRGRVFHEAKENRI